MTDTLIGCVQHDCQHCKERANWEEIARALAERVDFAVRHLKGDNGFMDMETGAFKSWREYMADAMEMIPGCTVDREILATYSLPKSKRIKAIAEIKKQRETP